jgi:thiosulfate dehydrogenase
MNRGLIAGLVLGAALGAGVVALWPRPPAPVVAKAVFVPPRAADASQGPYGDAVRLGARLLTETAAVAPQHVGNGLVCANCHLDAGRKAGAAPLWAAFVNFPAYRAKNDQINSFQKRVQDCFLYSLNGKPPALGSRELLAIEAYAAFMAKGLPSGETPPGRGFPKLAKPALAADAGRGALVYAEKCSHCHGTDGAGVETAERRYPPLWGARSFNWGAGMATIDKAAAFIHANMPLGQERSLSVQQAWDVATFIDGQVRPQDPRYVVSPQATRALHHDSPLSLYGTVVAGQLLGAPASTPPPGQPVG